MDDILNRISELLNNSGIAKGKFLSDLGFNRSTYSDWINGKSKSYRKNLPEIADYFGVTINYLLGNGQKNKSPMLLDDLTPHELELIKQLREGPEEITDAVYRLAGIPDRK